MLIPRKQFALAAPFLLLLVFFSTIVWGQTPTLVTPVLKDGFINSFYSDNLFIGGPTLPSAVVVNGLPAGITFTHNGSGSVLISGTPTMPGKYPLTISATNASGTAVIKLNLSVVGTVDLSMFRPPDVTAVAMGGIHSCAVVAGGCSAGATILLVNSVLMTHLLV